MQSEVQSVKLQCSLDAWEKQKLTKANKLPHPKGAVIMWPSTRMDHVELEFVASGAGRDVFSAKGAGYVLKLQQGNYHEGSNKKEALLA